MEAYLSQAFNKACDPPVDVLIRNLMLRADKPARDWPNRGQHLNYSWGAALTDARANPLGSIPRAQCFAEDVLLMPSQVARLRRPGSLWQQESLGKRWTPEH